MTIYDLNEVWFWHNLSVSVQDTANNMICEEKFTIQLDSGTLFQRLYYTAVHRKQSAEIAKFIFSRRTRNTQVFLYEGLVLKRDRSDTRRSVKIILFHNSRKLPCHFLHSKRTIQYYSRSREVTLRLSRTGPVSVTRKR